VRIRILEALESRPMGFAEIKKAVGIESSGHLQFHLRKLGSLVTDGENGTYALTDDGREALRVFRTTAEGSGQTKRSKLRRAKTSEKAAAFAGFLVLLVLLAAFAASGGLIYSFHNELTTYPAASYVPGSWYTIQFNGTGGKWVDFSIALGGLPAGNQSQQVIPVHIQLAHAQGINLESLELQFERVSVGCCWVFDSVEYGGIEGYPPPSAKLYGLSGVTTLDLRDFGFVGTGSVNIFPDFILDNANQFHPPTQNTNDSIGLVIVMQLQDSNHLLVANDYYGYAYVPMTPQVNGLLTIDHVS
jgi:DNA-binding HxlR family transcriptional regulator